MEPSVIARRKPGDNATAYGTVVQAISNKYTFHLDDAIGPVHEYRDLTRVLLSATEHDEVEIILNGPGGYLDTCSQLVNLIQACSAEVTGILTGPIASAHTFIFLACHSWIVYPHTSMMAHSYSGSVYEKGKEIMKSAQATQIFFEELVNEIYYPFYTEEEVDLILDNKDVHLHAKEITKRLDNLVAYRLIQQQDKPISVE